MRYSTIIATLLITVTLGGCENQSEMRRNCEARGGEVVRIKSAKASHYECVIRLDRP